MVVIWKTKTNSECLVFFRDVYLLARERNYLQDFFIQTQLDQELTRVQLHVACQFVGSEQSISWQLFDPQGN